MRLLALLLVCLGSACDRSAGASAERGSKLFASVCARCHGDDGGGGLPVPTVQRPRNFRDAAFHGERNDGELRQVREVVTRGNLFLSFGLRGLVGHGATS